MSRNNATACYLLLETAALPLVERARKLLRLEQTVLKILPNDLSARCKVLNIRNKILILETPSSAWAARLRFAAPELLRQLQSRAALNLDALQVRVRPAPPESPVARRSQPKISMESGTLLAQTANGIEHRELKEALFRLAAKAREF